MPLLYRRQGHGIVIQVIYTVASGVADDILEAYAQLVGHWYRRVKTQSGTGFVNISSQKIGEFQSSYRVEQLAGLPVPPDVLVLLASYRVPSL